MQAEPPEGFQTLFNGKVARVVSYHDRSTLFAGTPCFYRLAIRPLANPIARAKHKPSQFLLDHRNATLRTPMSKKLPIKRPDASGQTTDFIVGVNHSVVSALLR